MLTYPLDASLPFAVAAPTWLLEHGRLIRPNTIRNYRASIKHLSAFIGDVRLSDIDVSHLRRYQQARRERVSCHLVNEELSVLGMILKEAGEWQRIHGFYKPIPVPKRRGGHSISKEQERILREVAFSRPKWRLAAHCTIVMLSTTMGFGELRHVRRRDMDLKRRCILVRDGAKNFYRDRTIPLNSAAYDSMCWVIQRWERLGGKIDDEFILPHRPRVPKGPWILTEPMTGIATAFNGIRKEAGLPQFRVYDCRVQAITKLLSNPAVSPQVSKEIAGHISQAMQSHYSIQQFDTKMAAVEALEAPSLSPVPSEPTAPALELRPPPKAAQMEEHKSLLRKPGPGHQDGAAAWGRIQAEARAHYAAHDQLAEPESSLLIATQPAIQAEIARQLASVLGKESRVSITNTTVSPAIWLPGARTQSWTR
jgi:integrase